MWKRLTEWFKSLFKREKPTTQSNVSPATSSASVIIPSVDPSFKEVREAIAFLKARVDVVTAYDLQVKLGRGMSPSETDYAKREGVVFKADPAPVESSRSLDPDLSDGAVHGPWVLADGQPHTVTFNRAGKVRVWGSGGTQVRSLTDPWGERKLSGTIQEYEREFFGPGSYTFSVTSSGGNVVARLL